MTIKKGWDIPTTKPKTNFVKHFYLKKGESAKIIFIDDEPVNIEEHTYFDGKFWQHSTCLAPDNCPFCDAYDNGVSKYRISYLTIFDCRDNTRKLIGIKSSAFEKIKTLHLKYKGLKGKVFTFERSNDSKSYNIGDIYFYEGEAKKLCLDTLKQYKDLFQPFDYEVVLKPMSYKDAYSILVSLGKLEPEGDVFDSAVDDTVDQSASAYIPDNPENDDDLPF